MIASDKLCMSRSQNLPRMQGAFIDALVSPVFKLLAELLPLVHTHCIDQMHVNRSFWNSMQNQNVISTHGIIAYLKGVRENVSSNEDVVDQPPHGETPGAIPGIPANAVKGHEHEKVRKLSLVPMQNQHVDLDDLEQGICTEKEVSKQKMFLCGKKRRNPYNQKTTTPLLSRFLNAGPVQIILLAATVLALVANDINLIFGNKDSDITVDILTLLLVVIFVVEMVLSVITVAGYTHFFLWLDLAASISLLLEINFFMETGASAGELALAKASRAAKVGARAGR